jgi:alpha-galactosidase
MKNSFFAILLAVLLCCPFTVHAQKFEHLADTPAMGWNSWNKFYCNINEDL